MDVRAIWEGWRNSVYSSPEIKEMAKKRLEICLDCDFVSTKHKTIRPDLHCTDCGCPLFAKTKSSRSGCPKGKWMPEENVND